VRRADIHSFKDESILQPAGDKSYRYASAYRDVVTKRERAKKRAAELSG
jgi:hypothetical protein